VYDCFTIGTGEGDRPTVLPNQLGRFQAQRFGFVSLVIVNAQLRCCHRLTHRSDEDGCASQVTSRRTGNLKLQGNLCASVNFSSVEPDNLQYRLVAHSGACHRQRPSLSKVR
jgi:hypothetical protein